MKEVLVSAVGAVHTGQLFVGDLVRTYRSRSQCSHMRGVPGVSIVMTGYG